MCDSPLTPFPSLFLHVWCVKVAACCGWVEVLEVLLQGGAEVGAVTQGVGSKKWTALHYAARHGEDGAARLLVAKGAQVRALPIYTLR